MDYAKQSLADALAANYVTGTLRHGARRRFESLMGSHPSLRAAVHAWEARLMPLTSVVEPVAPSAAVWAGIERRLGGGAAEAAPEGRFRWSWWPTLAGLSSAVALVFGVMLAVPPAVQPPVVVVLAPSGAEGEPLATQARFVASVSGDGRSLVLRPVEALSPAADRAFELWAVPAQGAPRSLGVIDAQRGGKVIKAQLLNNTAAFAVSLEPRGGSPTGLPTGPVISVGKLAV